MARLLKATLEQYGAAESMSVTCCMSVVDMSQEGINCPIEGAFVARTQQM